MKKLSDKDKVIFKKVAIYVSVLLLSMLSVNRISFFRVFGEMTEKAVSVNPVRELFEDSSDGIFVFLNEHNILKESRPNVRLPFAGNYRYENGVFSFLVNKNELLRSVADGIVKSIGYKDSIKYIEIIHSGNIKSVYENVEIIGVTTNLKVASNQIIATLKENSVFRFYFTYNDEIISDYQVIDGEIIWKN